MTRRKVLLAVGGASAVGGAVLGTDAFSSIEADRAIEVAVAGDASALLALEPAEGANGDYASIEDGQLRVDLSTDDARGANPDAVTVVRNVFQVTNQGTQDVGVWISDGSDHVTFRANGSPVESEDTAVILGPGESQAIGMVVDTSDASADETLLESMTVHADAAVEPTPGGGGGSGPDVDRTLSSTTVQQGSTLTATITVPLSARGDVDIYELFDAGLGTATLDSATVGGTPVDPLFVDLDAGGGFLLFDNVGPGTLEVTYTVAVTDTTGSYGFESAVVEVGDRTSETDEATVTVTGGS